MYTKFFGLCEYPFDLTSDLRFFYSLPLHEEALSSICSVVRNRQGLALLTGEPGTGKTTLLQRLTQTLGDTTHVIMLPLAAPTFAEILSYLCEQFSLPFSPRDGLGIALTSLEEYLLRVANRGSLAVLIIDEAQHLDLDTLDHLCQLLRLEGPTGKLLQIVLAGQSELEEKLAQPKATLLHQSLASWQRLSPFPNECVGSYIRHRLAVAGCEKPDLFTPEAIRTVGLYSQTIPRLINVICDNALLTAYRLHLSTIPLEVITQVVEDLQLPQPPAMSNKPSTDPLALSARHRTPRRMFVTLRASLQPFAWASVGFVIGWVTAPTRFPPVQLAQLSQEAAQVTSIGEHSSRPPTTLDSSQNHQVSQTAFQPFGPPASVFLPSAAPAVAEIFVRQEPSADVTLPTRSEPTFPSPSLVIEHPSVPPNIPSPTSQQTVSPEVARIIAILKHPISPASYEGASHKSTRARSSSPPARRTRPHKCR